MPNQQDNYNHKRTSPPSTMPDIRRVGPSINASEAIMRREPQLLLMSWRAYGDTKRAIIRSKKLDGLWFTSIEQNVNPWRWDSRPRMISMQHLMPRYDASWMTLAERNGSVYEKKVDLLWQGRYLLTWPFLRDVTLREIETCEALRRSPHPNVCFYRGVTVDEVGLVCGLVFDRYDTNLHDMVREGRHFDAAKCLTDLQQDIAHLHSLGFVHCDIEPENIFALLQAP